MLEGDPVDLAVVSVDRLTRWSSTYTPGYQQMSEHPGASERTSPFPFDERINSKIAYWTGDLTLLNAQAIVCCNNESFTDNDPLTSLTLRRAGASLGRELYNNVKGCRTGEAKITKAYMLPSRHVIHTVGPRFNLKYKTAAENALYNCYRNVLLLLREHCLTSVGLRCIHSTRRGYPSVDGAHIALRTVRRFLEKSTNDTIDLIVFVVTGNDREVYNSLLPLYFPRSLQEEQYAAQRLPVDVGNEFGEPVIDERKIRISGNPAKEPSLNNQQLVTADNADEDDDDDDRTLREIFNSSVSIGEHAFCRMEVDVDKRRRAKLSGFNTGQDEGEERIPPPIDRKAHYARLLKRAKQENFNSLHSLRFLYQSGFDQNGRPVIVFIGRNFPAKKISQDKAAMYFISQMDHLVSTKYVFVYVHTLAEGHNEPSTDCLTHLYEVVDDRYKNNLEALYMLHASFWAKMTFWWLGTFRCPEIKSRIQYLPGVENLFARISLDQLDLPEFVLQHDLQTNGTRYYNGPEQGEL